MCVHRIDPATRALKSQAQSPRRHHYPSLGDQAGGLLVQILYAEQALSLLPQNGVSTKQARHYIS